MNPAFRIIKPPQLPDIDPEYLDTLQQAAAISLRAHQRNIEAKFKSPKHRRALRDYMLKRHTTLTGFQMQQRAAFQRIQARHGVIPLRKTPFDITTIRSY